MCGCACCDDCRKYDDCGCGCGCCGNAQSIKANELGEKTETYSFLAQAKLAVNNKSYLNTRNNSNRAPYY